MYLNWARRSIARVLSRTYTNVCIVANHLGFPWIVSEIVLLSLRPGNLPNVPGSLANWPRFQAHILVYDIYTRKRYSVGRTKAATCGIAQFAEFANIFSLLEL